VCIRLGVIACTGPEHRLMKPTRSTNGETKASLSQRSVRGGKRLLNGDILADALILQTSLLSRAIQDT